MARGLGEEGLGSQKEAGVKSTEQVALGGERSRARTAQLLGRTMTTPCICPSGRGGSGLCREKRRVGLGGGGGIFVKQKESGGKEN